ncbi:N-acetylmuramoyl-L-alanine amidase [Caloramator quimbayensis]|uniref:N-acetylmuramoyl-L-alanine amidase n=1 Tax=Caloramator quimbayensis TaxID=1147123 RepID=A0A1T4XUJ2_9CLOT|nr:N-acetylmuramoyl-L-alanine amidase CwlD [Caloramator quimbayensis]SKA93226.1 N-acetylmuramoyl-L-alanine amidase [Caloramator quimbayensis]
MNKNIKQLILVLFIAAFITTFDYGYMNVFIAKLMPTGHRVIIVDAGHGGMDGGAIGKSGTIEKNINLEIAKKLKAYIEESGDVCIMIREVDEGLYSQINANETKKRQDLKKRKEIIKENNADAFISIHLNSFPQAQYYGAQVFYPKGDENSKLFAKIVQEELIKTLNRNNKRVEKETDVYYIILNNNIPSILVECGFLSNPEEERLLNDENYQNKVAWALYCGIMKYFATYKNDMQ